MKITPWEVRAEVEKIDYERLVEQFGVKLLDAELLQKLEKLTGELHLLLRRQIFFSHRDFDWILERYEAGKEFCLYTGRGPSGQMHLGHLLPLLFTQWLQEKFGAELYFQFTDDEKFLIKDLTLEQTESFSYQNALDVIACGFKPELTHFIVNTRHIKYLYKLALKVAKHLNYSTIKAAFGLHTSSNVGIIFFPTIQMAVCFLPSELKQRNVPCLIPASIDQDPYWRVVRDVAPRLGYYKPAQIHCKFLPGLARGGKMSASQPETAIFTTDSAEVIEQKIKNAYDAGQPTLREQRLKGGIPEHCPVFSYYYFLFEPNDAKLEKLRGACKSGELVCGECKSELAKKVVSFVVEHQRKREDARQHVEEFLLQ